MLTKDDNKAIEAAIAKAEARTSAEVALVVTPASDGHLGYLLAFGLLVLNVFFLLLLLMHVPLTALAVILLQAVVLAALCVPHARPWVLRIVPKKLRHARGALRALAEFQPIQRECKETPVVMLFVSYGERYAHIIACPQIQAKIKDEAWAATIASFASDAQKEGLSAACISALGRMADLLEMPFPDDGGPDKLSNQVIEKA